MAAIRPDCHLPVRDRQHGGAPRPERAGTCRARAPAAGERGPVPSARMTGAVGGGYTACPLPEPADETFTPFRISSMTDAFWPTSTPKRITTIRSGASGEGKATDST